MKLRRFCNEIVKSQNKRILHVRVEEIVHANLHSVQLARAVSIAVLMIQNNLASHTRDMSYKKW